MPRVLHLRTVTGQGGGPEKTLLFSPLFIGPGYEMRLAYFRPYRDEAYDMPQRAERMGVVLEDIPERGPLDPRALLRLHRIMREFRPHILHAHDYKTNLLALLFGRVFGCRVLTTMHGYGLGGGRLDLYYQLDKWTLPRMDHVIAVSPDLDQRAEEWRVPRAKRTIVDNAIDTTTYRREISTTEAKTRLGFDPSVPIAGAVGRLTGEKGFDVLIAATQMLVASGQPVQVLIIGDGPLREELSTQVQQAALEGHVRLVGHCENMLKIYEAMDLFVLSSRREALPNVLLEAMAMKVPVVATKVGGVSRLVQNEMSGLLVPADQPSALANGMTRLLEDRALRTALANAARSTIEMRFSFEGRMKRVREIYDQIVRPTGQR